MFADDEDVVAGELSECEDDDKEAGVVAGQSRQLSASASARAHADEEGSGFMDLTSPDFISVPAPSRPSNISFPKPSSTINYPYITNLDLIST